MTSIILCTSMVLTLLVLLQPARARRLAAYISPCSLICAVAGNCAQAVGLHVGGNTGHVLVALGLIALFGSAWTFRHCPGGRLLNLGVVLNGIAMVCHGRMPLTPEVLAGLRLDYPPHTVLAGTKDIVAEGMIAECCGDRFVVPIPMTERITVWSVGDLALVGGMLRAATHTAPMPCQRQARGKLPA